MNNVDDYFYNLTCGAGQLLRPFLVCSIDFAVESMIKINQNCIIGGRIKASAFGFLTDAYLLYLLNIFLVEL